MAYITISYKDKDLRWPKLAKKKRSAASENLGLPFRYGWHFLKLAYHTLYLYAGRPFCFLINFIVIFGKGIVDLFGLGCGMAMVLGVVQHFASRDVTYWVSMALGLGLTAIATYGLLFMKWKDIGELHEFLPGHGAIV